MSKVFVSVINYNGKKNTVECLNSLKNIETTDFSLFVVVIDNNSRESFDIDKNLYQDLNLEIIKSEKNLGFSGGHNLGIKFALENGADYVLVLNNDVILDKKLVINLLEVFNKNKDCGIATPKIYFAKGHEFHKERYKKEDRGKVIWYAGGVMDWKNLIGIHKGVDEVDNGKYEVLGKTDFASGCCMMIKKEVFQTVGFFDEAYFLYYEDNDLSMRAKNKGYGIYYQPKAILWHINAGSVGGAGSFLQDYYISRNRLLFGVKYAPFRTKLALLRESLRLMLNGRKWQKKGVIDFYSVNLGKGSFEYE